MNLHVIIGEDDFLVEEAAKKVIGDGLGLEVIDSMNSSNEELRLKDIKAADASFSTPPFLDPKKVTWWKNVKFLPGGGKGGKEEKVSEAVKLAVEKFVKKLTSEDLPENQHFILSGPSLLKTSIVAKTLQAKAEMLVFAAGKPWEQKKIAAGRAMELAEELGLSFAFGVVENFIDRVGVDTRSIMSELNKMRAFIGAEGKTITNADVEAITSAGAGVEPEIWSVTGAIGERNAAKLVAALERFEGENGYGVFMTTIIERFFRNLVDVKNGVAEDPRAARYLGAWSVSELRRARAKFVELRERAVSGGSVDNLILTEALRAIQRRRA